MTDYPEGYDSSRWGPSGNLTINGTYTFSNDSSTTAALAKRGTSLYERVADDDRDLNAPPYAIHNGEPLVVNVGFVWEWRDEWVFWIGFGDLSVHTVATNATHANGMVELDVHNLFGYELHPLPLLPEQYQLTARDGAI